MDYQVLFNVVLGGFSFLAGFILNNIWNEVQSLHRADRDAINRLSDMETLVAGNYITRAEFGHTMDRLFTKLDTISTSLNSKVDRA